MNYEIYVNESGNKRVKFENGIDYCVETNKEGKDYFHIPNIYIYNPENDPFKQLFIGRIKDAITAIREDQGDVLSVSGMFGPAESVYRFVDRVYGEELRQKTIEGFKNAEFGYSLKFGYLDSMSGSRFISKDYSILSIFENQNDYMFFNTEEEAETVKQEILLKSQEFIDGYKEVEKQKEKASDYLRKYYNNNVFCQIGYAVMLNKGYELEIVQAIKQ